MDKEKKIGLAAEIFGRMVYPILICYYIKSCKMMNLPIAQFIIEIKYMNLLHVFRHLEIYKLYVTDANILTYRLS